MRFDRFCTFAAWPEMIQYQRDFECKLLVPIIKVSFDYVIVGGGTAGPVLATWIAEVPSFSLAMIEARGFYEVDDGNISTTPVHDICYAGTDANEISPLVEWGFVTESQAVCFCF